MANSLCDSDSINMMVLEIVRGVNLPIQSDSKESLGNRDIGSSQKEVLKGSLGSFDAALLSAKETCAGVNVQDETRCLADSVGGKEDTIFVDTFFKETINIMSGPIIRGPKLKSIYDFTRPCSMKKRL